MQKISDLHCKKNDEIEKNDAFAKNECKKVIHCKKNDAKNSRMQKIEKISSWCILVKVPHILVQMPHSAKWIPDSYSMQNSTPRDTFL